MKPFFSAILFFVCSVCCMADIPEWQKVINQKKVDSLQLVVQKTSDPKEKIDILNQMSRLLWDISAEQSYDLGIEASILSIKNNYSKGLVDAYTSLAVIAEVTNEYRMSIFYWEQAIAAAEKTGDKKVIARFYVAILNSCFYLSDYRKIIDTSIKGIPIARQVKDQDAEVHFLNSLGFVLIAQNNYDMALRCYNQSLVLSKQLGDTSLIGKTYSNLGKIYNLIGDQKSAIKNYTHGINILVGSDCIGDYASALNGLAKTYLNDHNYPMALKYAKECSDFVELRGGQNAFDLVDFQLTLGEIHLALNNTKPAISFLENGLKMSTDIKHKEFEKRGYEDLSKVYAELGQFKKAFEYQKKYSLLKDSLSGVAATKRLVELETQAEIDKKNYDIQLLSAENEVNKADHQRINLTRNIVVFIFILVVALFFLLYNRAKLKEKNRLLAEIGQQQNILFNTVVSLQDKERKRIAEDLHDGLGSTLSTIQLNLEKLKDGSLQLNDLQKQQYNIALSLSNEAVSELRNIAHNLMPSTLVKLGLIAALQNHFDQVAKHSGIQIEFETHGVDKRMDQNIEMSIFRIILEIVNNVIKHAKASNITVQFVQFEDHMNITVEDNGIGFNPGKLKGSGIGIRNIQSRIEFMKGTYSLDSSEGHGTTYIIDIPLNNRIK